MKHEEIVSNSPEETFELGEKIGESLIGGEIVLLHGGLGTGKTLLTKGILNGLDFDIDEVTSPSFTLVNLYRATFDVYHIDLWRIEGGDAAAAVGLDEILEDEKAVVIIEWAERLGPRRFAGKVLHVNLAGDGDEPRKIALDIA
ncbi:MAG: tRNA (adenosine(37)-N6)-threonylcarbamoyltransferase complex ATPase subunit type 1 TsaE [Acidobacteriota bacterium]